MFLNKSPVFAVRDFRFIFLIRFCSMMALQVQAVIVGWQVYQLHPDPLLLGLIGLVEAIPAIGCSFISGHIVDIKRPVSVFRWSLLILFINTVVLWMAVAPSSALADSHRLLILYAGIFISGAARSFTSPSIFSIVPQIMPRSLLGSAAAWNSSAFQFAAIIGPVLGGVTYGALGARWAFLIPPLLMLAALVASGRFSPNTRALHSTAAHEPFWKSISAGVRFAISNKALLSTMTLDMFSVLFGGAVAVLPVFADQIFKTGSVGLGLLRTAPSVGSVLVALYLATRPMKVISGRTLLWVVAGFGAATVGFALSNNFYLALIFLALSGAFDGVSMVIRSTLLQLLTPDNMRGRVSALSSVFITSSNEIGAFESGLAARFMGLVTSVVFGGSMTLAVVAITAWKTPELRRTRITQEAS